MTVRLWHLCNFSAGPPHFRGGFGPDVLALGPSAWAICADRVKQNVPDAGGIVIHCPHGCYPDQHGNMQMLFEQRSRALSDRRTRVMASPSRIMQAIADVRSIVGPDGVKVYLGYPSKFLTEDDFIDQVLLWAHLEMPMYIDGNALPSRAIQHAWMSNRYRQLSGQYLGVEAVPDIGSWQDNKDTPMFLNAAVRDSDGRQCPGTLCHRGTQLRHQDGRLVDGTLSDAVRRCERNGWEMCMNLDPQTDEAWTDLEMVRNLIAEGSGNDA